METQAQKFTSGPWKWHVGVRDRGIGKGNPIYEFLWNEKSRSSILAVNYHMSEGDVWQAWVTIKPENAQLIASAPDMLDALIAIDKQLNCPARNTTASVRRDGSVIISSDVRAMVASAITKATGTN